jgi:transposase
LWELVEPLIPPRPPARGPGGRPPIQERAALEGILFVLSTGCRWRDLPAQLGAGSGHAAWRRLRAWQAAGVWERLHQLVLDELSEAELLEWSRASIDAVSVRAERGGELTGRNLRRACRGAVPEGRVRVASHPRPPRGVVSCWTRRSRRPTSVVALAVALVTVHVAPRHRGAWPIVTRALRGAGVGLERLRSGHVGD